MIFDLLKAFTVPHRLIAECKQNNGLSMTRLLVILTIIAIPVEWAAKYAVGYAGLLGQVKAAEVLRTIAKVGFEKTMWVVAMIVCIFIMWFFIRAFRKDASINQVGKLIVFGFGVTIVLGGVPFLGFIAPVYSLYLHTLGVNRIFNFSYLSSAAFALLAALLLWGGYIFISGVILYGPEILLLLMYRTLN